MISTTEAQKFRKGTAALADLARSDLSAYFGALDLTRPEAARDGLLEVIPVLTAQYGDAAAAMAAEWYADMRSDEGVPGGLPAVQVAQAVPDAQVTASVRYAAGSLFTPTPEQTLTTILGALTRYVMDYSRHQVLATVKADPEASGWQRVTRPTACGFCQMLASRGGVYTSTTAFFASHDFCHCGAVPSWDPDAKPVDVDAYKASTRRRSAETRAADNARARDWISTNL